MPAYLNVGCKDPHGAYSRQIPGPCPQRVLISKPEAWTQECAWKEKSQGIPMQEAHRPHSRKH